MLYFTKKKYKAADIGNREERMHKRGKGERWGKVEAAKGTLKKMAGKGSPKIKTGERNKRTV